MLIRTYQYTLISLIDVKRDITKTFKTQGNVNSIPSQRNTHKKNISLDVPFSMSTLIIVHSSTSIDTSFMSKTMELNYTSQLSANYDSANDVVSHLLIYFRVIS